jgi:phosphate transport system substrate-binding protein
MTLRNLLLFSALLGLLVAGTSCGRGAAKNRLVLTGSSTVAPLVSVIAKRFEAQNPGTRVDVQMGGSSRGLADARRGLADIGMMSRGLKPDEKDVKGIPIARDGICLITHKDNPVRALTDAQVIAVYKGELRNWAEVGGHDAPITVVNKAEGRSTLELFLAHFKLKNPEIKPSVVVGDNEQGIQTVAGNPNAVGYVSIGTAQYDATHGVAIKLLPVGGVSPSVESVRAGTFPLSRPLNLVTAGTPSPLALRFIAFAKSEAVHDLVENQHFVPVSP